DQTERGARLLDLRDQRVVASGELALERGKKAARGRGCLGDRFDFRQRARTFRRRDLLALVFLDFRQDIAHGLSVCSLRPFPRKRESRAKNRVASVAETSGQRAY